jgi:hypothetical protein
VIDDLAQLREADNTERARGHGRQPFSTKNALCAFDGARAFMPHTDAGFLDFPALSKLRN